MDLIQRKRRTSLAIAVVLVSALFLDGCHTMARVAVPDSTPPPPTAAVFSQLKPGDNVRVTLRNGETVTLSLAAAQPDGLVAKDGRHIPYNDIADLEKRQFSAGRTILLGAGIWGAVAVVVVILNATVGWD